MILILRGSTYYKQSMLSVDSSALYIFIENILKSLYMYVSDEIKLIERIQLIGEKHPHSIRCYLNSGTAEQGGQGDTCPPPQYL